MSTLKILSAAQIRAVDDQTIAQEPIASVDLMERASNAFATHFRNRHPGTDQTIIVCCGPGNNGGDGLAIARILHEAAYTVAVIVAQVGSPGPDQKYMLDKLRAKRVIPVSYLEEQDPLPNIPPNSILIDGLFGSGLNRAVSGYWATLLEHCNQADAKRIAIDIPSGLFADRTTSGPCFKADETYSFQIPKIAFFAPENAVAVGHWHLLDIGLSATAIERAPCSHYYYTLASASTLLKTRGRFAHKGNFGHSLIIAGSYGKIGAAILCAKAALRAGCGLVTTRLPVCGNTIMQVAFPEAMVAVDRHEHIFTEVPDLSPYQAIGIGPGLGTNWLTQTALRSLLRQAAAPLVLDADALNILGLHPEWQHDLPANSILTPHPKEFERLFGSTPNSFDRWALLQAKAKELKVFILLKGGNSVIATPDGKLYFLCVGNPGMGTAGAGDVLTGIVAGLLAQGYSPKAAILLGVCLHGLAGDLAAEAQEMESLIAEDIIQYLGKAFAKLRTIKHE